MISLVVYLFAILFPVQKTQNYIVCKAKAKQSISTKDKVKSLIKKMLISTKDKVKSLIKKMLINAWNC